MCGEYDFQIRLSTRCVVPAWVCFLRVRIDRVSPSLAVLPSTFSHENVTHTSSIPRHSGFGLSHRSQFVSSRADRAGWRFDIEHEVLRRFEIEVSW